MHYRIVNIQKQEDQFFNKFLLVGLILSVILIYIWKIDYKYHIKNIIKLKIVKINLNIT